jgi:hypothetical protein
MLLGKRASYSERSAASLKEEHGLDAQIERWKTLGAAVEGELAQLERQKQACLEDVGRGHAQHGLADMLAKIEDARRRSEEYVKAMQAATAKLAKFRADLSEQLPERRCQQARLADLLQERLKLDRQVENALDSIRRLLEKREGLTAAMKELAVGLELKIADWDEARFGAIVALPEGILTASEQWTARLLGSKGNGMKPYVVCEEEGLTLPETLAHCGVFQFGDVVWLTDEDARELARCDRPNPRYRGWNDGETRFFRPSLMAKEEFEEVKAEAAKRGSSIEVVLFEKIHARHRELEQQASRPEPSVADSRQEQVDFPA